LFDSNCSFYIMQKGCPLSLILAFYTNDFLNNNHFGFNFVA